MISKKSLPRYENSVHRINTSKLILENNKCPAEKLPSFFRHVLGIFPQTLFKFFPFSDSGDCDNIFHCV